VSIANRLLFPADRTSLIYQGAFQPILTPPVTSVVIYADQAATTLADIVDTSGNAITGSVLQTDTSGMLPEFYGPPENVVRVWALAAGTPGGVTTPLDAEFPGQIAILPTILTGVGGPSGLPSSPPVPLGSIYVDIESLIFYGPYTTDGWPAGQPMTSSGSPVVTVAGRTGNVILGESDIANLVADLAAKAPLASPSLTGTPTAPTASALTNSTEIATTAYADSAVSVESTRAETAESTLASNLASEVTRAEGAESTLTTNLNTEIARAETAEATKATTSALTAETTRAEAAEALLAPLASPALTGTPTAPTKSALTNSTALATTAYTDSAVGVETTRAEAAETLLAPKASPALTGTPTAPTASALTSNTQLATTAYADSAVSVEKTRAEAAESTNATAISTETTRAENAEALLAPLASPALTGSPTAPTQTTGDSTTKIATDQFVATAVATETSRAETAEGLKAPLASPALTGTPTAPTASALTNSTQVATTAYTDAAVGVEKTRAEAAEGTLTTAVSTETSRAETAEALAALKANNLSDLASASTARTNLGLGTAATISATAGGDLSGTLPNPTVAKINGITVTGTPSSGQVLTATSSTAADWAAPTGTGGSSGTPSGSAGGDLGGTYPNPTVVATHLASALPINQGGTGSTSQNFVDLSTAQSVGGTKTFASPVFTGTPTAPTASALTDNTQLATTAYTDSAVGVETSRAETAEGLLAPKASPTFTGIPVAPTASSLTSNTQLATTAYADAAVGVETTRAETAEGLKLAKSANLSDVASASTALANLGGMMALSTTSIQTANYTAGANQLVPCNASGGTFTVTLPTAPASGTQLFVKKIDSSTNSVSIAAGGSDVFNISGGSTTASLTLVDQAISLQYSSGIWYVMGDDLPLGQLKTLFVAKGSLVLNIRDYGAVGNYQTFATGAMTASSATFTDTTNGAFTSANVGQYITVVGAGAAGVDLSTTISSVQSSTSVTLATTASTTVSAATYAFGTSDTTAINSAITAAASANAYTTGATVYFPPGSYALGTTLVPASNVALIGSGIGNSTLYPFGTAAAVTLQASSGSPITNITMAHLTIDGARQAGAYNVAIKGIFLQYVSHGTFEDLVVQNCIATGIGTDFLTNGTVIHNCRAINNGRLNHAGVGGGGGNGIGIGTGEYTVEDWVVSDCYASANGRYGIMMESQTGTTSYGMRISNCYSTANYGFGYGDAGGNGALWANCIAYNNAYDGFSIDNGTIGATAQPSGNSTYSNCLAIANSRYGFSYQPTASNSTSVAGAGNHSYRGCKAYLNTSLGFNINSASSHPVSGMTYTACEAYSNGASGLEVQQVSNDIKVSGCKFNANGQSSSSSKYGIMFNASVTGLQVTDCRIYDDGGTQKQAYGIYIASGVTVTTGHIANNDLRGNLTGSVDQLGTLTSCYLDNNAGYAGTSTRSAGPASAVSVRGDTAANWTSNNPTLNLGEMGIETDTKWGKVGDGSTAWTSLPYASSPYFLSTPNARQLNWAAWTGDPGLMNSNFTPVAQVGYFCRAYADQAITCAHAYTSCSVAGATVSGAYIAVYPASTGGAILGQTSDISSSLTTIEGVQASITGLLTSTALTFNEEIYLMLLINSAGTMPSFAGIRSNGGNLGLSSNYRVQIASGLSTPPSTVPSLSLPGSGTYPCLGIGA
jgi:Major tropism determinant N-terminal domain/Pectate lyase superfamily protein